MKINMFFWLYHTSLIVAKKLLHNIKFSLLHRIITLTEYSITLITFDHMNNELFLNKYGRHSPTKEQLQGVKSLIYLQITEMFI